MNNHEPVIGVDHAKECAKFLANMAFDAIANSNDLRCPDAEDVDNNLADILATLEAVKTLGKQLFSQ